MYNIENAKFKISVHHDQEHHLLGVSFSNGKNNRFKSLKKCKDNTIQKIINTRLFKFENPNEPFHPRDNIMMLKDEYKPEKQMFDLYFIYYKDLRK